MSLFSTFFRLGVIFSAVFFLAEGDCAAASPVRSDSPLPNLVGETPYPGNKTLYEFDNGLLVFVQKQNDSSLATVRAYLGNTGSQNEGEWLGTGISHLVEHLVCGGTTTTRSKAESTKRVAALGGGSNAMTGKDFTAYYIDCNSEKVPEAVDLIADWLLHPAFDQAEVAAEQGVITQELLDAANDPGMVAHELLDQTIYREHPARHPIGGYPDLLAAVTRDDIIRFHRLRYTPNKTLFYIAGNVEPQRVLAQIAELYRGVGRNRGESAAWGGEPAQIAPREAIREMDTAQFRLQIAYPTVSLSDPDLYALDVTAMILGKGDGARLTRRIQNERGIGSGFHAASQTPAGVPGMFVVSALARPEELDVVERAIDAELAKFSELAVPTEELAKAKKQAAAAFVFGRETLSSVADSTALNYLFTGDPDFDTAYLAGIRAVTAADVRRVAEKYFVPVKRNRILLAPLGMGPKNVEAAAEIATNDIEAFQLANGVRVLLKRTPGLPKVNMQVWMLGGSLVENHETAGRTALLAAMLGKGTLTRSRNEIEDGFDSVGGVFSVQGGRNTLGASVTVLTEDYPKAVELLADLILNPSFPEAELVKAKKEQLDRIARRRDTPGAELMDIFSVGLPPATPYHLLLDGTAKTIEPVGADDLIALHKQLTPPSRILVTVFGDISPDEAAERVLEEFGKLAPRPADEIRFDRKNEPLSEIDLHRPTGKNVGAGIVAWPAVSLRDEKEFATLTVLGAVLGGYRYPGGRLFEELRREGLVYRLSVEQMTGPAPGYFFVSFITRPDAVNDVLERIDAGIEHIRRGDLSDEEVALAKERIIAFHPQEKQTDRANAQKAALDDLYGLGYNNDALFEKRIDAVTTAEVLAAARKFFQRKIVVTLSPNPVR